MNKKESYPKFRFNKIAKTGGAHTPGKGGKYRRIKEKRKAHKEINTELS